MDACLLNTNEYSGQYVALKSETDNAVVGHGATPEEALNMATANGYPSAVLVYVEEPDTIQIYRV